MDKKNSLVSLNEFSTILREHGFSNTERSLVVQIENGFYPFAKIAQSDNKRRRFIILRKPMEKWIAENLYGGD